MCFSHFRYLKNKNILTYYWSFVVFSFQTQYVIDITYIPLSEQRVNYGLLTFSVLYSLFVRVYDRIVT